jgi:cyclic lactone autoinducer peptide
MKKAVVVGVSKVLAGVAVVFVSTASFFLMHRPEIPEELKK